MKRNFFFEDFVYSIFSTNFEQAKKNFEKPKKFFSDYNENKARHVLHLSKEEYFFFVHERYFFFFSNAILFENKDFFAKESTFSKKERLYALFRYTYSKKNFSRGSVANFEGFYDESFFFSRNLGREDSNLWMLEPKPSAFPLGYTPLKNFFA